MSNIDRFHDAVEAAREERGRQVAKFGDQRLPMVHPEHFNRAAFLAAELEAKRICDRNTQAGKLDWFVILTEELLEAAAAPDDGALYKELIQLAAVALSAAADGARR